MRSYAHDFVLTVVGVPSFISHLKSDNLLRIRSRFSLDAYEQSRLKSPLNYI